MYNLDGGCRLRHSLADRALRRSLTIRTSHTLDRGISSRIALRRMAVKRRFKRRRGASLSDPPSRIQ